MVVAVNCSIMYHADIVRWVSIVPCAIRSMVQRFSCISDGVATYHAEGTGNRYKKASTEWYKKVISLNVEKLTRIEGIYMYENLTKYLDEFTGTEFGTWIVGDKSDGTLEHPLQFPFVNYSRVVDQFIDDVYSFVDNHEEMGLHSYIKILEDNGIKWSWEPMVKAEVDNLDAQCIIALIFGAIRADRFGEGTLLAFLKDGFITKWLERLKTLDTD